MKPLFSLLPDDHAALDRPVWSALTTRQRHLALGGQVVRRYPPDVAPFCATASDTVAAYEAIRSMLTPEEQVALLTCEAPLPIDGLRMESMDTVLQMVATTLPPEITDAVVCAYLGDSDVGEMMQLAELTHPGPFSPRTHQLGQYIGIREKGQLIAMAGIRMRIGGLGNIDHGGYSEISAVCVHPEFRGKGHARALLGALMQETTQCGDTPFLHVFDKNLGAIALYTEMGFVTRQHFFVTRMGLS